MLLEEDLESIDVSDVFFTILDEFFISVSET